MKAMTILIFLASFLLTMTWNFVRQRLNSLQIHVPKRFIKSLELVFYYIQIVFVIVFI